MDPLKEKFRIKAQALGKEIKAMLKEHGDMPLDTVTIRQAYGGMRGIKSMIWETSRLDPNDGIRFRGYSIPELKELLPKADGGKEPLPEGLFWLMLVDEIPTSEDVKWLSQQWASRSKVSDDVFNMLKALPADTHPMVQLSMAISSMQSSSIFARRYNEGMNKSEYWDATYEDTMNLIAKMPRIAAFIYRHNFHDGKHIEPDLTKDWSANFAHMLGFNDDGFTSLMRLYLTIHADHEGGNASAHATHLASSTLSDTYLSLASGMNALAGPLHGLANQEVIKWIFEMVETLGTRTPTLEQIEVYVQNTLAAGKVIPGYGHAVLRQPDPRFTAQKVFAQEYIKDSEIIDIVWKCFDVVPKVLGALGKVKNPWPNVDAHSGALLVHYGLKEYKYYTVLFGVSRTLGVLSSLCWSRALGMPLERPKSMTTAWIKDYIEASKEN